MLRLRDKSPNVSHIVQHLESLIIPQLLMTTVMILWQKRLSIASEKAQMEFNL